MRFLSGAGDFITPAIKMLRGLNYCVAIGQDAIDGQKVLKRAGIACSFDVDADNGNCALSVREDDINKAAALLRRIQ